MNVRTTDTSSSLLPTGGLCECKDYQIPLVPYLQLEDCLNVRTTDTSSALLTMEDCVNVRTTDTSSALLPTGGLWETVTIL